MKKIILLISLIFILPELYSQQARVNISPDLELVQISGNAYMHVSYTNLPGYGRTSANGLIFINKREALLFDTPWNDSLTHLLVSYLSSKMGLTVTGFVPNHWHDDCMGGLGYIKSQNIKTYANQLTIDIAKKKGLAAPEKGFSDSLFLKLGDKNVFCYFFGAAHSTDNIVVWIPSEKILFPGCMCKSLDSNDLGNIADGSISEYPWTISKVTEKFKDAQVVIPGHGHPGGIDLLKHTKDLIAEYNNTLKQ